MKKKLIYILFILIILFSFSGCNFTINRNKPFNFYYTNLLAKNLTIDSSCSGILLDTNFYKEKELSGEDLETVKSFTKALDKNNFINKPDDLPSKPIYKIFFTFSKEKYVINVYNEKYLTIYPWDGNYPMDYIDMTNIYASYNLYNLCKYLIPR